MCAANAFNFFGVTLFHADPASLAVALLTHSHGLAELYTLVWG